MRSPEVPEEVAGMPDWLMHLDDCDALFRLREEDEDLEDDDDDLDDDDEDDDDDFDDDEDFDDEEGEDE
jgi:hypothetical protein